MSANVCRMTKEKRITVRLSSEAYKLAKDAATREGRAVSEWVRRLIERKNKVARQWPGTSIKEDAR